MSLVFPPQISIIVIGYTERQAYSIGKNRAHSGLVIKISPIFLQKIFRFGHKYEHFSAYPVLVKWSLETEDCFLQCFWEEGPTIKQNFANRFSEVSHIRMQCDCEVRLPGKCYRDAQWAFFFSNSLHSSFVILYSEWCIQKAVSKTPYSLFQFMSLPVFLCQSR